MRDNYDVIIIGSGPAGLSAAIYTVRGAASVLIIGGENWGGQLMLTAKVENFPGFPGGISGPDLMTKMRQQAEGLGAEFLEKNVDTVNLSAKPFEIVTDGQTLRARSLIITTGALTKWLDVPGEKELIGRGVSTCAPCDAPFFKAKKVAVVGGGDTAMEEASVLAKYAGEVIIIHRRDVFRASEAMQAKIKNQKAKIKILFNTIVTRINGKGKVESLSLINQVTKKTKALPVDGVFIAIGHKPNSDLFKGQLDLDEEGFVKVTGRHSQTSVAGVFVAGDVMDPDYKQAVTSAGSGCAAALDTLNYLEQNNLL